MIDTVKVAGGGPSVHACAITALEGWRDAAERTFLGTEPAADKSDSGFFSRASQQPVRTPPRAARPGADHSRKASSADTPAAASVASAPRGQQRRARMREADSVSSLFLLFSLLTVTGTRTRTVLAKLSVICLSMCHYVRSGYSLPSLASCTAHLQTEMD